MKILNIAAGKITPNIVDSMMPTFMVNVDTSYYTVDHPIDIEEELEKWENDPNRTSKSMYVAHDVFEFMEKFRFLFDQTVIYRFLEHVTFTKVEYFIYLVSTAMHRGGVVDVIVPNYEILAKMILDEKNYTLDPTINFHKHNILLTTELLNEPSCPHASIWTPERMKYFWELEERFKVKQITEREEFDGRDIYMRAIIERI